MSIVQLRVSIEQGRLTVAALGDAQGPPVRVGVRDDIRELCYGEPCTFELAAAGAG